MNEGRTTAIFAAVAAVSLGLAWMSKPEAISDESDLKKERTGQAVFAKFEDPDAAASFQIVKYDEALGQLERFEVAKDKTSNMWKLPSYDDYPADAAEQVRDATTPLISLPILNVASLDQGDHTLYGVVNPDSEGLTVGESGVGMLLRVKDNSNQVLAELVVGKEVDGAEGQRYVRIPSEDAVYVVELDTASFSTDFQKWINQELLEVRNFDISAVGLRDYAILPTQDGRYAMSRNFDADLSYDSAANKWSLLRLLTYESGKAVESSLAEGERLNDTVLNELRTAVQDLEIVNVRRKPKGLAADLKADGSLMGNKESLQSLVNQGFIPQESGKTTEIFATGGETLVGTQAGVKYLLRFGEVVADLGSQGEDDEEGEEESGLRRYLLVSAVFDDSAFPQPEVEPVPTTVEEMLELQKQEEEEANPADAAEEDSELPPEDSKQSVEDPAQPPAEEPASDEPAAEEPATDEPATEESASDEPVAVEDAAEQGAAADSSPAEEGAEAAPGEDSPAELELNDSDPQDGPASDEEATAEEATPKPDAEKTDAEAAPAGDSDSAEVDAQPEPQAQAPKTQEELEEELEFVRERIAKENQRKLDEYHEKKDAARKRVQELNARFADWYYVVSDNVYRKLKISRESLGTTEPAPAAQSGPGLGGPSAGGQLPFSFPGN
ncbi:MAG: DUF4340 domain-containing protein [Planctomycetales bacterium]|nr:DUF4340 domain-containing protein [Planctomycetales bacterium]